MSPSVNAQLADRSAAHAIDLLRFDSDARSRVLAYLRSLESRLAAQLSDANLSGGMTEFRRARAETLLRQVRETIAEAFADMADAADAVLRGLAKVESATAMAGVGKLLVATRFELNILTPAQLSSIVDSTLIQGAPSRAWWQAQAGDLLERFSTAIREGVGLGETNDELVRRVRGRATGKRHTYELNGKRYTYVEFRGGLMDTSTRNAEALVRTSVQTIAGQTRRDTFEENQDVVKGVVQVSTFDTHTTVTCRARAAKAWSLPDYQPIDHNIVYAGGVPLHWGCLPGDCLVTPRGRVSAASKRRFEGDLFILRTAGNRELACTPNHPILTARGWLPARSLRVGDHVVCDGSGKGRPGADCNHQEMPASIEDVANAFLRSQGVVAVPMPLTAEDFHGDAREGEVAVVGTDRLLRNRIKSALLEHLEQLTFGARRATILASLEGRRHLALLVQRASAAAHYLIGRGGQTLALCGGGSIHAGLLLSGSTAQLNALRFETAAHRRGRHAEPVRYPSHADPGTEELCHPRGREIDGQSSARRDAVALQDAGYGGLSDSELESQLRNGDFGEVELDELRVIEVRQFSGHIFNLETAAHHYVANGIITHNCRSTEAPLLRSWQELGIDLNDAPGGAKRWSRLDGKVPADFTMEQFLRRRSREQQDEMLGPGIAALWRARKVSLEELIDAQSGRPLALWEVEMRAAA